MGQRDLIDPELRVGLEALLALVPGGLESIHDPVARRAKAVELREAWLAGLPPDESVVRDDRLVPGPPGAPDVPVRIYQPRASSGPLPGVFFVHGGGMSMGDLDSEDLTAAMLSRELDAVVVSSGYRKAPEHVHPAQIDDVAAALAWMVQQSAGIGIDAGRLALVGGSAGGNLVLAAALRARHDVALAALRPGGAHPLALVMAWYPMLDPRHLTASSREITDVGFWDLGADTEAWGWFLGEQVPDAGSAPALAADLAGLPPVFLDVGTVDLFRDDVVAFAARLLAADVPTELHVYPGMFHAAETVAPDAALSRAVQAARLAALRSALRRR